jgi:hypothetical protein
MKTFHWDAHVRTVSILHPDRRLDKDCAGGGIIPVCTGPSTHVAGVTLVQMLNDYLDRGVSFNSALKILDKKVKQL